MLVIAASLFLNMLEKWTDARIAGKKTIREAGNEEKQEYIEYQKKRINIFYKEKRFGPDTETLFLCIVPYLLAFLYGVGQINSKLQKRS